MARLTQTVYERRGIPDPAATPAAAPAPVAVAAPVDNTTAIAQAYKDLLGRYEVDPEGLNYWTSSGQDINTIRSNIALNPAAQTYAKQQAASALVAPVTQAYKDILGRDEVDAEGLKYWTESGQDLNTIKQNIQLNENQQIAQAYKDILGRDEVDAAGLNYWAQSGQDIDTIRRNIELNKQQQAGALSSVQPTLEGKYEVEEVFTGGDADSGPNYEYVLKDPFGNVINYLNPVKDDYGNITGYQAPNTREYGENAIFGLDDLASLTEQYSGVAQTPYGTGQGPALGYEYGMLNAQGDVYQKYDAQGNLTEFLDKDGVFQKTSDIKPIGATVNYDTGELEPVYEYGGRTDIVGNTYVPGMSPFKEDQSGWLGEGGWKNIGMLALTALSAGVAAAASGAAGAASAAGTAGTAGAGTAGALNVANMFENAANLAALLQSGAGAASGLTTALEIGGQLLSLGSKAYDSIKDNHPEILPVIEQLKTETTKNQDAGMTREEAIAAAMESIGKNDPKTIAAPIISNAYEQYFGEKADQEGLDYWLKDLEAGASIEDVLKNIDTIAQDRAMSEIQDAYLENFGTEADEAGLYYWLNDLKSGQSIKDILGNIDTIAKQLGKGGTETVVGGEGNDVIDTEIVDTDGGTTDGDTDGNINDIINEIIGGAGNDTLISGEGNDTLTGGAGNDINDIINEIIFGGGTGGTNTIIGGSGNDTLISGEGNDTLTGSTGNDTLTGSTGNDTLTEEEVEEEEEEEERKKREQLLGLLAQTRAARVKTPEPAKIEYMYDIGDESVFATPKQESLMPSPYEDTPEAVEGVRPYYQYFVPGYGYTYAGGGMVAFDEGGDVTQEELEAALRPATYNQRIAAYGEKRRAERPEKKMSADDLMLAEIAAGFHPVIGPALSAKDFEEARGENNYLGMGLAGLGMIPVLGGAIKGYNRLVKPALRNRAIEKELVENWGKIPKGQPIPEGYIGGPSPAPRDYSPLKSSDDFYSAPKFQTDYGREFTHDLMHSSPSPNITSFDPRSTSNERARQVTLDPMSHSGGSSPNPLLQGIHSSDDITTFLSGSPEYSSQYLPTKFTVPTPVKEGKLFGNSYTMRTGMPEIKEEYIPGGTMYPVSARLGKVFDPESADAVKVVDSFLDTIQPPKDMDTKTFNKFKERAKESLIYGDTKSVESAPFREFLKNKGFDSFAYIKGSGDKKVKNYGVFEPNRIRGKYAEFNPEFANSPEIMKAEGGLVGSDDLQTIDDLYEMLRSK